MLEGQIAALVSAIGWAAAGVAIKPVTDRVKAVQVAAVYSWAGVLMTAPVILALGRLDGVLTMPAVSAGWLALAAATYSAGDLAFLRLIALGAVGWAFVTTTSLFILFSLLAGALFEGERVAFTAYPGAIAIVAGVYLLSRPANTTAGATDHVDVAISPPVASHPLLRLAVPVGIALLWTAGLVGTDHGVVNSDPFAAALILNAVPAVAYLTLAAVAPAVRIGGIRGRVRRQVTLSAFLAGIAAMAWTYGIKFETAGIVAILTSSTPLFAVILAAVFLRERLGRGAVLGVGLCLAGIATVLAG